MKFQKQIIGIFLFTMVFLCCDETIENGDDEKIMITSNIRYPDGAVQLFSFSSGTFTEDTYDIRFFQEVDPDIGFPAYKVGLNSAVAAAAIAVVDTVDSLDFNSIIRPKSGYSYDDSLDYIIGNSWYGDYDPVTHGMSSNGTVYFIFTADFLWVKFMVEGGATTHFSIMFAIENEDGTFGETTTMDIEYPPLETGEFTGQAAYFDFSSGTVITPSDWHFGFGNLLNFSEELAAMTYVPTALINFDSDIQLAIIDGIYEDISEAPANTSWWTADSDLKKIWSCAGDGVANLEECTNAVLIYDFPTYNSHLMQVLNPNAIYLINTGDTIYKLKLEEDSYSSSNDGQLIWFMYEKIL